MTQGTFIEIDAYDPSRSNLAGYSRQIDNGYWTKVGSTIGANAAAGTDNLVAADKLTENAANSGHYMEKSLTGLTTNQLFTLSVFAKAAGRTTLQMTLYAAAYASLGRVTVDLSTGACTPAAGGTGSVAAAYAQAYGGGWWRVVLVCQPETANNGTLIPRFLMTNGGTTYLGDGTSGILLDRILLEVGSVLGEPIDTTTAGPGIKTLRYASVRRTNGAADVPPHVVFDPRISEGLNFSRKMFGDFRVKSGGEIGYGLIKLRNDDHALAPLLDLGVVGREVRIYVGEDTAAFPAGLTLQLRGTVEQLEVGDAEASLRLRDKSALLAQPLQATKFAGTNALPAGMEGVAGDLKGKEKPKGWGRCYQAAPPCVNTAKRIYLLNAGAVSAIDAVYEGGAAVTYSGTDHANQAALEAATPAAGQFDKCTALGAFRLGSDPTLKITADFRGDSAGGYIDRVGAILRRILETQGGVATAEIDTASFAALDAAANYEVGYWTAESTTLGEALMAIRQSVGAWCVPNRSGIWQAGRLEAPAVSPDFTLTDADIVDIDRVASADKDGGVPIWRVELRYRPWFSPWAEGELAGGLAQATKAGFLAAWRTAAAEDASVKTTHPQAAVLQLDTMLTTEADAVAEAGRLLALHKVRRDLVQLRLPLTEANTAIDLGKTVQVTTPALGYGAGRSFRVVGVTPEDRVIDLLLWG